jgi:hypothetical protein
MHVPAEETAPPHRRRSTVEELLTKFRSVTWNYTIVRQGSRISTRRRSAISGTRPISSPGRPTSIGGGDRPRLQIPIYGTHIWEKTPGEIRRRREALSWTLSPFMHGEQGALLAAAQIVDATPSIEAKFYGATQVMDRPATSNLQPYLREAHAAVPMQRHLKTLLDRSQDGRWDMKYLGMQIMVEGLAMAAFGFMHKMCKEPLLPDLTHYVMRDESRHVAFGVLSLNDYYMDMKPSEKRDREEFLAEGCRLMRDRLLMEDVWLEMGWPVDEVREIVLNSPQMQEFRKLLFSKIVPNVKRLGLLTPFVRERFAELGILQFENEEPDA